MSEINPYQSPEPPIRQFEPLAIEQQQGPEGIGGWLILLAIGLVLSPIRLVFLLLTTFVPLFTEGVWEALTSPNSPYYNSMWAPVLIFEIVVNVLLMAMTVWMLVTFFGRKRIFPKLFMTFAALNIGFIVLDAWLASFVLTDEVMFDENSLGEFIRPVLWAAVWVPYLLVSVRARNTFVR